MLQGAIIGLIGTAIGAAGGYAISAVLDRYRLISLPMEVYQISYVRLPSSAGLHAGHWGCAGHLFRRNHLPLISSVAFGPGGSAEIPIRLSSVGCRTSEITQVAFLEITALSKSYPVGGTRLAVLRNLELTVDHSEMVAIVGASGVGKSTLMHVVGGLDRLDGGRIRVGETDVTNLADAELVAFRNRHVGFVFQFHHLLPEFSALENAEMPLRIARVPPREARERAQTLLEQVGLADRVEHRPGMLSGGEQQRVAMARALGHAALLAAG